MCNHGRTRIARPSRPIDTAIPAPDVKLGAQVLYRTTAGHEHLATVIGTSRNIEPVLSDPADETSFALSPMLGEYDGVVLFVMSPSGKTYVRQAVPNVAQTRDYVEADFTDEDDSVQDTWNDVAGQYETVTVPGRTALAQLTEVQTKLDTITGVWVSL